MLTIGVLALQGSFAEHQEALNRLTKEDNMDIIVRLVKLGKDMDGLNGLIIPGGESTVMRRLAKINCLDEPLKAWTKQGKPTLGTCAGLICLAETIDGNEKSIIGGLDIVVKRNAYGRQLDSFSTDTIKVHDSSCTSNEGIFIRAPEIMSVGPAAEIVASYLDRPVGVQQGGIIGLAFHPELTGDLQWHRKFIALCKEGH